MHCIAASWASNSLWVFSCVIASRLIYAQRMPHARCITHALYAPRAGRRRCSLLLAQPVLLHQPATHAQQADQVEALAHHDARSLQVRAHSQARSARQACHDAALHTQTVEGQSLLS